MRPIAYNPDDIERLLVDRGYKKSGIYNVTYLMQSDGVEFEILQKEYSFGMRYDLRTRLANDPAGFFGKKIILESIVPSVLYQNIEEIEVGIKLMLPQL